MYQMEFPVGLDGNVIDPAIDVKTAIEILHKHPECRIEAPNDLIGWGALVEPEMERLSVHPFEWHPLEYYVEKYSSLEEYLEKGYVEWRGGYGCKLIVPQPIQELPFRILISSERGRDSDGDWHKATIRDCHTGKIEMYYSHAAYFSAAGNGTYIYPDPIPRTAKKVV